MDVELTSETVKTEQLGSLGLIASVIHELGIIDKIDERLALNYKKGGQVSYGQRAAAMILNGLGFMNSRLYMTTHFFQDKPVEHLLGAKVTAEQLNDDCLGRLLDKIHEYGVTKLYSQIAFSIATEKELLGSRLHMDTTSLLLYGAYEESDDLNFLSVGKDIIENCSEKQAEEVKILNPAYGYSKANRPDLKQVILSLTQGGAANIPLWMEALSGNSSDQTSFHETARKMRDFMSRLENMPNDLCFIVDAAFYNVEKLKELDAVKWITRVPSTLAESKAWLGEDEENIEWEELDENYKATSKLMTIKELEQRWVLIYSKHAYERNLLTMNKKMLKSFEQINKTLWHLSNKVFECPSDAQAAIKGMIGKLRYHTVTYDILPIEKYDSKGRPKENTAKKISGYRISYYISSCLNKIKKQKNRLGRFILATNELNTMQLTNEAILRQYKEQSSVESGFKFIKNSAFELDIVFLNTPERIEALMMIMTLCLMVYNFAQYKIRKCLVEHNDTLPNQHGKPVKNPTMKWIAEIMVVISVVTICAGEYKNRIVANVNQVHRKIIGYFGPCALKMYGLPPDLEQVPIDHRNYKNFLSWCEM